MFTEYKTTNFPANRQIAGVMPFDSNIEFIGNRKSKTVLWLQNGSAHYFMDLPVKYFMLLKRKYLSDPKAQEFLSQITDDFNRQVELFTYYLYGDLDNTPDIENGQLAESENFRDCENCPSLIWNSKNITIGHFILKPKHIMIIDLIAKDLPDKAIAGIMKISIKTLDYHKEVLFRTLNVHSKVALLKLAIQYRIIEV